MDPIELSLFSSQMDAICEEMGATLRRTAFSPNIKDRLDFSCAIFNAQGELCAQAAHIPVHLGSMAYAMQGIVNCVNWQDGDMLVVNDPYLGGTHLPDVTLISPVFTGGILVSFVANRAHHADIGAQSPGSMPISSSLEQEGLVIPPTLLIKAGELDEAVFSQLTQIKQNTVEGKGDFAAQTSANGVGVARLAELIQSITVIQYQSALDELNNYAHRLAQAALQIIPDGDYEFSDMLDDDGMGNNDIKIVVSIKVCRQKINVDFNGTAAQVKGNINCPLSVAAAAVFYVFRCLMPVHTPACAGSFRAISLSAPKGCLLNAQRPAAVAAGNVETSMRIVDVVIGALSQAVPELMPAASQGTMNNLAMGARLKNSVWDYYETIGGGMGASQCAPGLSAVQSHMTNTLNTPIEVLEMAYPVSVSRYEINRGSGGKGYHSGGDGIIREFTFSQAAHVSLITERRKHAPWGVNGGEAGLKGENVLNGKALPGKISLVLKKGDRLIIKTPGGGGWGRYNR
ncbi:MAG: hydantoinase B/oxoprolinase family protein [Gammaproteobacteria bacterium]|nr:hydantoinase B/oxoprolinase family protein [Gammaproteobacteria bacterium]